jgi:hypothetical protein
VPSLGHWATSLTAGHLDIVPASRFGLENDDLAAQ